MEAVREKGHIMYNVSTIIVTADFSSETIEARRQWDDIFEALKNIPQRVENRCSKTCKHMFIIALYTTAKVYKQLK